MSMAWPRARASSPENAPFLRRIERTLALRLLEGFPPFHSDILSVNVRETKSTCVIVKELFEGDATLCPRGLAAPLRLPRDYEVPSSTTRPMNPATERAVYTFATPSLPAPASMPQRTPAVGNAHLITSPHAWQRPM